MKGKKVNEEVTSNSKERKEGKEAEKNRKTNDRKHERKTKEIQ